MKRLILAAGLVAALAGGAQGAALNANQVGAGAKWVLHVDADMLRSSAVGKVLMQKLTTGKDNDKLNALAVLTGVDLRKDLSGATLYSASDREQDSVVMLSGRFNTEHLITMIKANEAYETQSYHGTTVHSWIDEKKHTRTYGAVLQNGGLIVMSGGEGSLKAALDAVGGQGPSLAKGNSNGLALGAAGTSIVMASANLASMKNNKPSAQTFKQAQSAAISIGEEGQDAVGKISLTADSPVNAQHLSDAARGILALIMLDDKTDQKTKDAFAASQITVDGSTLNVNIHMPAQVLADAIQKKIDEDGKKKEHAAAAVEAQK